MFDRSRRFQRNGDTAPDGNGGSVATSERDRGYDNTAEAPPPPPGTGATATTTRRTRAADDAVVLDRDARLRQRDEVGGVNWGAGLFRWVLAVRPRGLLPPV